MYIEHADSRKKTIGHMLTCDQPETRQITEKAEQNVIYLTNCTNVVINFQRMWLFAVVLIIIYFESLLHGKLAICSPYKVLIKSISLSSIQCFHGLLSKCVVHKVALNSYAQFEFLLCL